MNGKLAAIVSVAVLCACAELGRSVPSGLLGTGLRPYYAFAQDGAIAPAENLIVEGVPAIPASLVETAGRYGSYRNATLADWNPVRREMLIATRFADTAQLHLVKMPGGERQQLTFFADAVGNGRFHPNGGDYIVFSKDVGGGEWYQLYRYDVASGNMTLLTDEGAEFVGAVVFEWRSDRVYVDASHGKRYRLVGDESRGPEERSFADKARRRRVGTGRLVAG